MNALTRIKAQLSPHMLLMKFLTWHGTCAIQGDQLSVRTCYAMALKSIALKPPRETVAVQGTPNGKGPIDDLIDEAPTPQTQPAEDLETVVLNEDQLDRCVKIGTTLTQPSDQSLFNFCGTTMRCSLGRTTIC